MPSPARSKATNRCRTPKYTRLRRPASPVRRASRCSGAAAGARAGSGGICIRTPVRIHRFKHRHSMRSDGHEYRIAVLALGLNDEGFGDHLHIRKAGIGQVLTYLLRSCGVLGRAAAGLRTRLGRLRACLIFGRGPFELRLSEKQRARPARPPSRSFSWRMSFVRAAFCALLWTEIVRSRARSCVTSNSHRYQDRRSGSVERHENAG